MTAPDADAAATAPAPAGASRSCHNRHASCRPTAHRAGGAHRCHGLAGPSHGLNVMSRARVGGQQESIGRRASFMTGRAWGRLHSRARQAAMTTSRMRRRAPCGRRPEDGWCTRLRGNVYGCREPRSSAGYGGRRPGRTTDAIADRVAYQVSLVCAPRPPGLRRGGTRDPATPPHPQRHPCRRGAGLRRPGHCPPGTAPPPDSSDVCAAQPLSPTGRSRATSLGVRRDPRLRHGQRRGFWDPRLGSRGTTAPARPPTTFRQVAPTLLRRTHRVPDSPRLAPLEAPPTIHDPISLCNM